MDGVQNYLALKTVPDATSRNWSSYGAKVAFTAGVNVMDAFNLLPDPQTNGGLLIAIHPDALAEVTSCFKENGLSDFCTPIGSLSSKNDKVVTINP